MISECRYCEGTRLVAMFPEATIEVNPFDPLADFWLRLHDTTTVCSYQRAAETQQKIREGLERFAHIPNAPIHPAAYAIASSRIEAVKCYQCEG